MKDARCLQSVTMLKPIIWDKWHLGGGDVAFLCQDQSVHVYAWAW